MKISLAIIQRLQKVKKAEFYCGVTISKQEVLQMEAEDLLNQVETTFVQLKPLYQLAAE